MAVTEIILKENVPGLGAEADIIKVDLKKKAGEEVVYEQAQTRFIPRQRGWSPNISALPK